MSYYTHRNRRALQRPLELALHAAVGVMNEAAQLVTTSPPERHLQGIERQVSVK
jgi:hypothetical protein